ncbi:hypothetical protein [Actinomadura alba]|uniref:Uncharacterized protein n=1 Tax=Actinomadura alba TaxID=406431 RepID=A0ABR7LKT3_9ACTN|nr:hypothetical protein [Actinomadura alba]MBC6464983.1 hypothetical protein [Actinomadura alba]
MVPAAWLRLGPGRARWRRLVHAASRDDGDPGEHDGEVAEEEQRPHL